MISPIRSQLLRGAAVLLVLSLASPAAWSLSWWGKRDTREGLMAMVRNRVLLWPKDGAAKPAALSDAFQVDDRIKTYPDSACRVLFMEDSFLNIGPSTEYTLTRSRYDEITGARDVGFSLAVGRVRLAVGRLFGRGTASVETPTAVVGVKGTEVIVDYDDSRKLTTVLVLQGLVEVQSKNPALAGSTTEVSEGEYTEVDTGAEAPTSAPAPEAMVEEYVSSTEVPSDPARSVPDAPLAEAETPPTQPTQEVTAVTDLTLLDQAQSTAGVAGGTSDPGSSQTSGGVVDQPLPEIIPPPVVTVPPDQCPGLCP